MTEQRRPVVLGGDCATLRRRLGPTAWVVLEELLARSTGTGESCRASVSVRALAAEIGLSKDTVARALVRLRHAGIVTACQTRSTNGAFTTGSYLIVVPDSVDVDTDGTTVSAPASVRSTAKPSPVRRSGPQLALDFD